MITVSFDPKRNTFVHARPELGHLFWGADDELVHNVKGEEIQEEWTLHFQEKRKRLGPLVGILCGKMKSGELMGNRRLFMNLQNELQESGGVSFLFTLEDCFDHYIEGTCYIPLKKKWIRSTFPLPNIIYNRLPSRLGEKEQSFIQFKEKMKQKTLSFFNPSYIDKFSLYSLFSKHKTLSSLLPPTILIDNDASILDAFLSEHTDLYIKPTSSSQGNGIKRIKKSSFDMVHVTTAKKEVSFPTFEAFWKHHQSDSRFTSFLAQKTIESRLLNGRKFDYRILSHYHKGRYLLTGIGIRVAKENGLTTHVPRGGTLYPYKELQNPDLDKQFEWIANECGKALTKEYGFFGEFTLDVGEDKDGKLWLYEVNAKPMAFDEKDIEENKIKSLSRLFHELTHTLYNR
ncbi:YheC/YheD family protein [Heyndrickxia acidicola]|uniref:YheC/YheD family protein n=1 Tax=Heyndrickxia acidicola TaxID=209389 RepID=A0ABU6MGL4_9BACI|nr:YheC/YheD family protein [Heyndrickxia acidicola]MED1202412.1 YheC/YheD family protein [Heyndrickxia acidicola]